MTEPPRENLLSCTDLAGRSIYSTVEVAEHIRVHHPEIVRFLDRTCEALEQPDFVYQRIRSGALLYYRQGLLTGRIATAYMVVVVRYNESGDGVVRTVYPTTRPATGDRLIYARPSGEI